MRYRGLVIAAVLAVAEPAAALAADPRYPDWPCAQIKVPELSIAAVWAGPAIDDVGSAWEDDPAIRNLVAQLAARRTPLADAEKRISEVVTGSAAERQQKAKLIFAGLFKTLNQERGEVMNGIERFTRKQKEFADQIRATVFELRAVQDAPRHDEAKIDELGSRIEWETRVFEERQKTIGYVCEVPVLIEQRLFALARAIAQSLE
jgi:DNA polymerase III alpha subunit